MEKKNELTNKENNDIIIGKRLITFSDNDQEPTPTELMYTDDYQLAYLMTPVSMMEGDIHNSNEKKYSYYMNKLPGLIKELYDADKIENPIQRKQRKDDILFGNSANNNIVEMIFETEENLFMLRKQHMTMSALFVTLTNIFNEIVKYNQKIADILQPHFGVDINPHRIYYECNYNNGFDKTNVFCSFLSHIILDNTNKSNKGDLAEIVDQSARKLIVEYVDRPITLTYSFLYEKFSKVLLTYCTPDELNRVMEIVSYHLIYLQSIMIEIVFQLISDFDYLTEDCLQKLSVYLYKLGRQFLPTED